MQIWLNVEIIKPSRKGIFLQALDSEVLYHTSMLIKSDISILKGKRIGFVTAGYAGKRFIYEKAHSLGVCITIIDSDDSWSKSLIEEGIIDHFISVDFGQDHGTLVCEIVNKLEQAGVELDGVCTFAELSLPVCAKLAQALSLPGTDPEVVSLVRDKHRVRQVVAEAGLNEIRSYSIKSVDDLEKAAKFVGFPSVLKPVSGADSLGVVKVSSIGELREALLQVQSVVGGLVVSSGALARCSSSESSTVSGQQTAGKFIALDLSLEEYLNGPEVDVDLVLYQGECAFVSVVDNGPTIEPYFSETWNLCPSALPADSQSLLVKEALSTVKALGFQNGVFHVEERLTSKGPRIIEVNARMGGGPIRLQHKFVYGVDLVVEQLLSAIGAPPAHVCCEPKQPGLCFASATPNVCKSGKLSSLSFLDPLRNRSDLVGLWEFANTHEHVVGPEDGQPSWLCEYAIYGTEGSEKLLTEMLETTHNLVTDATNNCYA